MNVQHLDTPRPFFDPFPGTGSRVGKGAEISVPASGACYLYLINSDRSSLPLEILCMDLDDFNRVAGLSYPQMRV